jgi:hypothetical protein
VNKGHIRDAEKADADLPCRNADDEGENDRSLINVGHQNPIAQPGNSCQIEFQLIHLRVSSYSTRGDLGSDKSIAF